MARTSKKNTTPEKSSLSQATVESEQIQTAVIGSGFAAVLALSLIAKKGEKVIWMSGTGSRVLPPLPSIPAGEGAYYLGEILKLLEIDTGSLSSGCFVREFKNKAFKMPTWEKYSSEAERTEAFQEVIGGADWSFCGSSEMRFAMNLNSIEQELRNKLENNPLIFKLSHPAIIKFENTDDTVSIQLGSGEEFKFKNVVFADRWTSLIGVEGLPKGNPLLRGREAVGVLQATFKHTDAFMKTSNMLSSEDVTDGFLGTLHRESGETVDRRLWGYFTPEQNSSVWTTVLGVDEGEDNHEIAKKLRRIKQALEKMFAQSPGWLPEGVTEFVSTITDEFVRFEEGVVFSAGKPPVEAVQLPKLSQLSFITDAYGVTTAALLVGKLFSKDFGFSEDAAKQFLARQLEGSESYTPAEATDTFGVAQAE